MHILLSLEYGGAERVAVNLVNQLHGNGFECFLCLCDKEGPLLRHLSRDVSVEVAGRKQGIDFVLPFKLKTIMRRFRPDIVHMHNSTALFYGVVAAKLAGIQKLILTQHGTSQQHSKMHIVIKMLSPYIKKAVAVSENSYWYCRKMYGLNNGRLKIIMNGIEENLYKEDRGKREEVRKRLGIKEEFIIGHIARLSEEKDQSTLLYAFAEVAAKIEKVKLIIVGEGPLRNTLHSIVYSLRLEDKVIFVGGQDDIASFLNIFDLFVLSSVREGTSLTLLEAMAAGVPVVATNVGGNSKVVLDNKTGMLVPPKNPNILAEKIMYLLNSSPVRRSFAEAARERVVKEFSIDLSLIHI